MESPRVEYRLKLPRICQMSYILHL